MGGFHNFVRFDASGQSSAFMIYSFGVEHGPKMDAFGVQMFSWFWQGGAIAEIITSPGFMRNTRLRAGRRIHAICPVKAHCVDTVLIHSAPVEKVFYLSVHFCDCLLSLPAARGGNVSAVQVLAAKT